MNNLGGFQLDATHDIEIADGLDVVVANVIVHDPAKHSLGVIQVERPDCGQAVRVLELHVVRVRVQARPKQTVRKSHRSAGLDDLRRVQARHVQDAREGSDGRDTRCEGAEGRLI